MNYFTAVLTQGDYYLGSEISGTWHGQTAALLGLTVGAAVKQHEFKALLEGLHPKTRKQLAQRIRQDRRPGVDLTFSVPKSVSLVWGINRDERILAALRATVHETMTKDVEPLVARRVRTGAKAASNDRVATGNLVYADFVHTTARPVAGTVDPHLHVHAFIANVTFADGKPYAADLQEIFRQRPSLQAKFEARLARRLEQELGYALQPVQYRQSGRLKTGWEIKGVRRETIEKFSRRTQQVEATATAEGITDAAAKGKLGLRTRERKNEGESLAALRAEWRARLTPAEAAAFAKLAQQGRQSGDQTETERLAAAVEYALAHHLHRESTIEKHVVVATALEQGLTLTPEAVEAALHTDEVIHRAIDVRGMARQYVTTRDVLAAEERMIAYARDGRGTRKALGAENYQFNRSWLNDEQKRAVQSLLTSRDAVMAISGGAGTGKTTLMQEAAEALRLHGKEVFVFAPSSGARDVLSDKGFAGAQTVEHLLRNTTLQAKLKDQVIWVDEAGLLDTRSMNAVFAIAQAQRARVVLSGDCRQHSSPSQGDAFRLLQQESGLHIARIETIQRQAGRYKQAVELISRGYEVVNQKTGATGLLAGFDLLDQLGKITELPAESRYEQLAERYLAALTRKQSVLVVAPTHAEGEAATAAIRQQLQARGAIGTEGRRVLQLKSLSLTTAEKGQRRSYQEPGLMVQFHQNAAGGFKRGERYRVVKSETGEVALRSVTGGSLKPLPLAAAERFEVYRETERELCIGDRIRLSLGGPTLDRKRQLANGRLDEVGGFDTHGNLRLKSGATIARDYGHLDLGFVVTSHAAQGKDRVVSLVAMSSQSLAAVNAKQWYVSVSRGKEQVEIFVDDKAAVRRAIQQSGERLSATELMRQSTAPAATPTITPERRERSFLDRARDWWRSRVAQHNAARLVTNVTRGLTPSGPELSRA